VQLRFVSAPQGDLSDPILVALKMVYFPCIWVLKVHRIVAGKTIGKILVCTLRSHVGVGGWANGRGLVGLIVTLKKYLWCIMKCPGFRLSSVLQRIDMINMLVSIF